MPRGHLALHHALLHDPSKRQHFLIGHQRHGSNVVRPMTDYAVLLQQGRHVLVVSDFRF